MNPHRAPQTHQGAITLLMATGLVLLAALASVYSSRSVLMDQLAGQNHTRASQSRMAAEDTLAWAQTALAQGTTPLSELFAAPAACPKGVQGLQWQCAAMTAPTSTPTSAAAPQVQGSVTVVRDVRLSPHVLTLHAQASLAGQNSRSVVRESLFMPVLSPAPGDAPQAALVLNGCASEAVGASLRVCPLSRTGQACSGTAIAPAVQSHFVVDTNRNGSISTTEKTACMALNASSLPGGGSKSGPNTAVPRSPCNRAAWRSVFGDITEQQLQAWSTAQERNGLHAQSTPPRTVYWVDSPGDWGQSVGTASEPALLVFSSQACALRCPRIAAGTHIHGSVVLDAGCNDEKMRGWQGGWIEGQLVVESGLPEWRSSTLWARPYGRDAYVLNWPDGIDPTQVQRINGSWSEVSP